MFDATEDIETNLGEMTSYIGNVKTGEVTYAIRDSKNNGLEIKKDDFMGLYNGKIVLTKPTRIETAIALVEEMVEERSEIITIMYGKDVEEDEVNQLVEAIEENHEVEVDLIKGGQEVYSYIISVE
jgi:dihydroxyacetone kinase-like predicted kinase